MDPPSGGGIATPHDEFLIVFFSTLSSEGLIFETAVWRWSGKPWSTETQLDMENQRGVRLSTAIVEEPHGEDHN